MAEDKNCRPWDKPYYSVAEVAAYWCQVTDRAIRVDEKGLPERDPQNGCLRTRAEWIMDAIDCGELACGRDGGPSIQEQVARPKRTVRRTDLRQWFQKHRPQSDWPAFLFDEIERKTHAAINADSYRTLQADLEAARTEIETARKWGEKIKSDHEALQGECMSLRAMVDKGLTATERNTLLTIIAALCDYSAIKPDDRGAANQIAKLTEEIGATVSDDTVRRWLKLIPDALATRMK